MSLWTQVRIPTHHNFFSIVYIVSKIVTEAGVSCVLCNKTRHTARKGTGELYPRGIVPQRKAESYTDGQEIPYIYGTLAFAIVFTQSHHWTLPRAS